MNRQLQFLACYTMFLAIMMIAGMLTLAWGICATGADNYQKIQALETRIERLE